MNPNYLLNFTIPQGPTGPTGPTSGLAAYGGKYNSTSSTINLGIGTQTQVPLPTSMPNLNTTYTAINSINVTHAGTYEINYFTNLSVALGTTVTLTVRVNGTNIPAATLTHTLSVGTNSIYNGSVLVTLPANSMIDMTLSALVAIDVTLGSETNASRTIRK